MKVGIIGTGSVGTAIGTGLVRAGHEVRFGSRNPGKAKVTQGTQALSQKEASRWAEVVVLAVPFGAVKATVDAVGPETLKGKVLVDVTNVLGPSGLAVGHTTSGAEELAKLAPGARVVKAFNTVFAPLMSNGTIGGEPITLPVAGDDGAAKETVIALAKDLGFDSIDAGPLMHARYLEPLAMQLIQLAYGPSKMGPGIGFKLLRGT